MTCTTHPATSTLGEVASPDDDGLDRYRRFVDYVITGDPDDRRHALLIEWIARTQLERQADADLDAQMTAEWRRAVSRHTGPSFAELQARRRELRPGVEERVQPRRL